MKKQYLFFLAGLTLFDIIFSFLINADLFDKQKQLARLQEKVVNLEVENGQLKREVAQLSSLNRIAKLASGMGLVQDNQRLLVVSQDQFAMR